MRFHIYRYSKYNTKSFWLEDPSEIPEEKVQPQEYQDYLDDYGVLLETPITEDNIQTDIDISMHVLLARECCNWAATYDVEASLSDESSLTEVKAILADVIESKPNIKRKFEKVENTKTEEQRKKRIVVVETPTRTESLKKLWKDYDKYKSKYRIDEEKEKPYYFIVWLNENNQVEINENINFNQNDKDYYYNLQICSMDYFQYIDQGEDDSYWILYDPPYEEVNNMQILEPDKLDNFDDQCAYLFRLKDIGRIISLKTTFVLQPTEEEIMSNPYIDIAALTEDIDNCSELDEFPEIKNGDFESIADLTPEQENKINNTFIFHYDIENMERRANIEYIDLDDIKF